MTETTTPPALNEIAAALAKAKQKFTIPKRTKKGQQGNRIFMYAPLSEINEAVDGPLSDNGLACPSYLEWIDGHEFVTTDLVHSSGQFMRSRFRLSTGLSVQDRGKEQTYGHRYNKRLLLDITDGDADLDDGAKAGEAGYGSSSDRDKLVELMGEASLGNKAIMDFCRAQKLGDGASVEDLTAEAVRKLVDQWPDVVKSIKLIQRAAPANSTPAAATAAEKPADDLPGLPDLSGLAPDLVTAMGKAGVSKAQLKAYYVGAKHLPDTVEPEKLPPTYLKQLLAPANWKKAVEQMTKIA